MKSKKQKIALLMIFVLLSSCAIRPPSVPLCTEINPQKGYCINSMTSEEYEISDKKPYNGKTWWEMRPYMIYLPVDSWVGIKKFIIKICKKSKRCSGKSIGNWSRTVKSIDEKIAN